MRWVGIFLRGPGWSVCPLVLGLLAVGCSKTDDGFDGIRRIPDGGGMDGSAARDGGGGGPGPSAPFIEQPDDGDDAGAPITELPPYDVVGTSWHYSVTTTGDALPEPQVSSRVQTVTETFTWPDGRDGARHETTIMAMGMEIVGPVPAFAIESDRIVLEEVDGAPAENLPALETVVPLQVGTRFGPRPDAAESRVTALEEITVPAGTFQAYKLEAQWPASATKATEWWAEGVGMVRAESTSPGASSASAFTTVIELEELTKP